MEKETGGPAFPLPSAAYSEPIPGGTELFGMTLRDYFAAKAMQGWYACPLPNDSNIKTVAEWAYRASDAMLEARK